MAIAALQARDIHGNELYQGRARVAFPILVRQALSREPIFYESLATELDMPNPRNLNYVLGCIGSTIDQLSGEGALGNIPHIQSLVINRRQKLPGPGFDVFLSKKYKNYEKLNVEQKKAYLGGYWSDIYAYPHWLAVLAALDLSTQEPRSRDFIEKAKTGRSGGGGEGPEHRLLKEYVAQHPDAVGLSRYTQNGTTEAPLPSGDRIDVLFETPKKYVAIEIKSKISNEVDIIRGLFQCVKYKAVMEAERGIKLAPYSVECILVLGKNFPKNLISFKNALGVNVIELIL